MFNLIDFSNYIFWNSLVEYRFDKSNIRFYSDIEYEGEFYKIKSGKGYRHACISEYIGSHIFNLLGCEAQDTLLGVCDFQGNQVEVVACKYITGNGEFLYKMDDILDAVCNTDYCTNLNAVNYAIYQQNILNKKELATNFWKMFIIDLYICNADRYADNWGVVYDCHKKTVRIAPVFDCDASLFSGILKDSTKWIDSIERLQNVDIFLKDTGIKKYENDKKRLNVTDYLLHTDNEDCLEALASIAKKIDEQRINAIIDEITLLNDKEKNFYKTVLHLRKTFLIDRILHENEYCKSFL